MPNEELRPTGARTVAAVLIDKVDALHDAAREAAMGQAALSVQVSAVIEEVVQLRAHVIDGNGAPGLIHRVAQLEIHRQHDRHTLAAVQAGITSINHKLDQVADTAVAQVQALRARDASSHRERAGYVVALVVGVIGFTGCVVQALVPIFFQK